MRRMSMLLVICLSGAGAVADGSSVTERVKVRGVVRCGSVERPGLAEVDGNGRWHGLEVDVCRAVAAAVLGSPEKIAYRTYETPKEFDAVREQQDDIFFLSGSEIHDHRLEGRLVPGPTIFVESHGVIVPASSPVKRVGDLVERGVCFLIGSTAERAVSAALEASPKTWLRRPFSEEGEMNDAYNAQNCHAVAGELTTLAALRLNGGVNRVESRVLPELLTPFPVIAATAGDDGKWASIVAWTVGTLVSGERPQTRWHAGGVAAMPIDGLELGLDPGWQKRVLASVGNYGDVFERNLGSGSPFRLERGLNASPASGGLLLSPFLE